MTTEPQTIASLTAKRARLETTRDDLTARLKGRAAELELLNGREPSAENVSAFVQAESEHRDVAVALERTERSIADLDRELERLNAEAETAARFEELVSLAETLNALGLQQGGGYERLNEALKEHLEPILAHLEARRETASRLKARLRELAPAHIRLSGYRTYSAEQNAQAERVEQDLKARGVNLRDVLENDPPLPRPFGTLIVQLLAAMEEELRNPSPAVASR